MVGTRTGSPPFGFIDKQNNWGGFWVDLAKLVHGNIEKKFGKPIKFELKESTPATRIPLLTSGAVDLIAGTMTITRARRDSLDFSAVFFVTGADFLVKKGSPIRGVQTIAGKRIGAQRGRRTKRRSARSTRRPSSSSSPISPPPSPRSFRARSTPTRTTASSWPV